MAKETKAKAKNRKADVQALGEWYINTVLLAPKAKDILAGADKVPARLDEVRKKIEEAKQHALDFGVAPANLEKALKLAPNVKALIEERDRLGDVEGRIFESAMAIVRKRVPANVLANLELTFEPVPNGKPLPLRFRIGKMRSSGAGSGSRGFTEDHYGKTFEYEPANGKHGVRGRVKVTEDGKKAFVTVIKVTKDGKDGKAKTHAISSFSQASRYVHKSADLTYANGEAWTPPNAVWQEVGKAKPEAKPEPEAGK